MKKLYTFFLVLIICTTANAQIQDGAIMAGGNLGFTSASNFNTFYLNPKIGYFFAKNVAAGLDFSYYNPGSLVSVGPFLRGYLTFSDFSVFGHTRMVYSSGKDRVGNAFGFGIGPGLGYFISDNVAIEAVAEYFIPQLSETSANRFTTNIGFQVYFNRSE